MSTTKKISIAFSALITGGLMLVVLGQITNARDASVEIPPAQVSNDSGPVPLPADVLEQLQQIVPQEDPSPSSEPGDDAQEETASQE